MKYERVNLFLDSDGNFSHATVDTNFGSVSILDELKFNSLLEDYAKQEGITVDDLMKNSKYVQIFQVKKRRRRNNNESLPVEDEEVLEETDKDEEQKDNEEEVDEEKEETEDSEEEIVYNANSKKTKKKNKKGTKKIITRLVAFATAGVVLVTGAIHLKKHTNLFNGKHIIFNGEDTNLDNPLIYQEEVLEQFDYTNGNGQVNGNIYIVDSGKDNEGEYGKVMEGVAGRQEGNEVLTEQLAEKEPVQATSDQILYTLEDNSRIASSSMFEVSEFINGNGLKGKAYYYSFENMFTGMDYNAVKVFSDMRNIVLRSAFEEKDIESAKTWIRQFYSMYTDFVYGGKSCLVSVNGKETTIEFDKLSDMAKATILDLGVAMLTVNLDYNYANGDEMVSKFDILDNTIAILDGEIVPSLLNKGRSR